MVRSLAFTTQGRLHTRDSEGFLMPTLQSDTNLFLWIDLENPTPEETKGILEDRFHFHPLSVEDCVGGSPSPTVEEYLPKEEDKEDKFAPYRFMVIHAVDYSRKGTVPIARAPDRVAHNLLDAIVDNYKPAPKELSLEIAELEQDALQSPTHQTLNRILQVKKEVLHPRQILGPQRDVLARFASGEFKLIRAHLVLYYRNVHDALSHISQLAQNYTDSLTGIRQVYLNMSSNQTGEVVKLLTLITVITTPLMMIGTWYGMNFHDMPELSWRHGYGVAGGAMLVSTVLTAWYFKKRKWF